MLVKTLLRRVIPRAFRLKLLHRLRRLRYPARLGTLRRTSPLSDYWGSDRGTPVDRYYIDNFIGEHGRDIHGRVLEIKDMQYTERFGCNVRRSDVLDVDPGNNAATIVADLAAADAVASNCFDCVILTQTLQLVYDTRAALTHVHRILRPGGVVLVTVPTMSQLASNPVDYWRFTPASCLRLFSEVFGRDNVEVRSYGNVLTAIAFLTGMAHEELTRLELQVRDERFPLIVAVRAVKRPSHSRDKVRRHAVAVDDVS